MSQSKNSQDSIIEKEECNISSDPNENQIQFNQNQNQNQNENQHFFQTNQNHDDIYDYYLNTLIPSIYSSLPILFGRLLRDTAIATHDTFQKFLQFITPKLPPLAPSSLSSSASSPLLLLLSSTNSSITSFEMLTESFLSHFDMNSDGHISSGELLRMKDYILQHEFQLPIVQHIQLAWNSMILLDWKIGLFLWRTCGGLLLIIILASIIPGRLHVFSGRLLRWPILGLTYLLIFVELIVYICIRLFIRVIEYLFANRKHHFLRKEIANAKSYQEWYTLAEKLDTSQGRDTWRQTVQDSMSYRYNWAFIQELIQDMKLSRSTNDAFMALAVLQQCTRKNVGGIMSYELFSYLNTGETKDVVTEFLNEVVETLTWITMQTREEVADDLKEQLNREVNISSTGLSLVEKYEKNLTRKIKEEKNKIFSQLISADLLNDTKIKRKSSIRINQTPTSADTSLASSHKNFSEFHRQKIKMFLKRARAAYGRTVLCLSGGAMMGNYHFGVVKALLEEDVLPSIISGTSAGSVVGALVCTRTDEELKRDLRPEVLQPRLICFSRPWKERIKSAWRHGTLFDSNEWLDLIGWFTCGDLTFEEAYQKTGRVFCIQLSATTKLAPPILLNHISAPNVVIKSAIVASAAVPGLIAPIILQVKDSNGVVQKQEKNKDQAYWDGSIDQDIPTNALAEMLNCQFFLTSQCNPHIVPFFYNNKGNVGKPNRWSRNGQDSWRGGFLLAALELYLKGDMKAKLQFLSDLEAAISFTANLWTQSFEGTTTMVPQVRIIDFFNIMRNPSLDDMYRYFQGGSVAAYQQIAMVKQHYRIAHAIEDCLALLGGDDDNVKDVYDIHLTTNGNDITH